MAPLTDASRTSIDRALSRKVIFFDGERPSDSPFVEKIWTSHSEVGGPFTSAAESRWEIVVETRAGKTTVYVRGPESRASNAWCPADGEWLGIRFRPHVYLRGLPPRRIRDIAVAMPEPKAGFCELLGHAFEIPTYENTEQFVASLCRVADLTTDAVIGRRFDGAIDDRSARTVQRRFAGIIGLKTNHVFQIERARHAATLLQNGRNILDAVHAAGYFDQSHLSRWATALLGDTPGRIADRIEQGRMSFLYKTERSSLDYIRSMPMEPRE